VSLLILLFVLFSLGGVLRFISDRDEIWHYCPTSKYACIDWRSRIFLIWSLPFRMAAMTSFHVKLERASSAAARLWRHHLSLYSSWSIIGLHSYFFRDLPFTRCYQSFNVRDYSGDPEQSFGSITTFCRLQRENWSTSVTSVVHRSISHSICCCISSAFRTQWSVNSV